MRTIFSCFNSIMVHQKRFLTHRTSLLNLSRHKVITSVFAILMAITFTCQDVIYSADQWLKSEPQGTQNMSDIDTLLQVNNEAVDRLLFDYRRNLTVIPDTINQVKALEGSIAIPNASGSIVRWRRTTSTTTITWSDIDTGAEASSTQYYVYATADTDITGMVFKISASSSAPSGATYYRKVGYFYNDSSGNIVNVGNIKGGDVSNAMTVSLANFSDTVNASYTTMTGATAQFVSSGRPILIIFRGNFTLNATDRQVIYATHINGTEYTKGSEYAYGSQGVSISHIETLASGVYTIDIRHKQGSPAATSVAQDSGAGSVATLSIIEL